MVIYNDDSNEKNVGHETDLEQEWHTPYIVELQNICVYIYILIYMCDPCGFFPCKATTMQ
jgi:hypothetical protein